MFRIMDGLINQALQLVPGSIACDRPFLCSVCFVVLLNTAHFGQIYERKQESCTAPCNRGGKADSCIAKSKRKRKSSNCSHHKLCYGADHRNCSRTKPLTACTENEDASERDEEPGNSSYILAGHCDDFRGCTVLVHEDIAEAVCKEHCNHSCNDSSYCHDGE